MPDDDDATTTTQTPAATGGDDGGPDDQQQQPAAQQQPTEPTFTQEQVSTLIKERLERDREAYRRQVLEDLGFEDADGLKEALGELKTLREEKLTDEEKRDRRLQELEKKLAKAGEKLAETEAEWQGKYEALQGEYRDLLLAQAFQAEAQKAGFRRLSDAYKLADHSGVSFGDDGKMTGVEEAVQALAKERPDLLASAPVHDINAAAGRGHSDTPTLAPDIMTLLPSRLMTRANKE